MLDANSVEFISLMVTPFNVESSMHKLYLYRPCGDLAALQGLSKPLVWGCAKPCFGISNGAYRRPVGRRHCRRRHEAMLNHGKHRLFAQLPQLRPDQIFTWTTTASICCLRLQHILLAVGKLSVSQFPIGFPPSSTGRTKQAGLKFHLMSNSPSTLKCFTSWRGSCRRRRAPPG